MQLQVFARDADTMDKATRYHFDCVGFPDEVSARQSGESLRQALRFLVAILEFPLVVNCNDKETGSVHDDLKRPLREAGGDLLNTRVGLSVFKDDDLTKEFVGSGSARVRIGDPEKVLRIIADFWQQSVTIDEKSARVLEILSLSEAEASLATRFLITYLAIEELIPVEQRDDEARAVLDRLKAIVQSSTARESDKHAMASLIGSMERESFRSAWSRLAGRITSPSDVDGISLGDLIARSVALRNRVAHKVVESDNEELRILTRALRKFAVLLIWSNNRLPPMSFDRPADKVSVGNMEFRLL